MTAIYQEQDILMTTCQRTGWQCPAACSLARHLAQAAKIACAAVPDFSLIGRTRLDGCAATCDAIFVMNAESVKLFCGVDELADLTALCDFSDAFLDNRDVRTALEQLDAPPAALARVSVGSARPAGVVPTAFQA